MHIALLTLAALLLTACQQPPNAATFDYPHRVIALDGEALRDGDLRYNIMLRDGDVIWAGTEPAPGGPLLVAPPIDRVRPDSGHDRDESQLRPGDTLLVTIYELRTPGVDDQQQRRIDEHGQLRLYVVGLVNAAGKTTSVLERNIANQLETEGILRDATVTVQVLDAPNRKVYLHGIERSVVGSGDPHAITLTKQRIRLSEAIQQFGGLPEDRWQHLAVIRRTANER